MFGLVGIAIDYSTWTRERSELQLIADAASLAGAGRLESPLLTSRDSSAVAIETTNIWLDTRLDADVAREITVSEERTRVNVALSRQAKLIVSRIIGYDHVEIGVRASAKAEFNNPICILALNASATTGIRFGGSSHVMAPNCVVWSNAAGPTSIRISPQAGVTAARICAAGQVEIKNNVGTRPDPESGCKVQDDPLAGWTPPAVGSCKTMPSVLPKNADGASVMEPGTYCGGALIEQSDIVMKPGIYVFKDGVYDIRGNTSIVGKGVGIYLTGTSATLSMSGGARLDLAAPSSGPMAGLAIAQNPLTSKGQTTTLTGNSTTRIEGSLYLPTQKLVLYGNSGNEVPPAFSQIIADTIEIGGSSELQVRTDFDKTSIPSVFRYSARTRLVR